MMMMERKVVQITKCLNFVALLVMTDTVREISEWRNS